MGFDLIKETIRCSGSQSGFDIFFKARPASTTDINVNFFVECKSARSVNVLNLHEFEGKPEQLNKSVFNPDYWILFSPLRYLGNDLQELLNQYCGQYPFTFLNWAREGKFKDKAGLYLDLFKHFPEIYDLFKADVPDNIRDIPAEYLLEDILVYLKNSIKHAYDEFQERVVHKGILPGVRRITPHSIQNSRETDNNKLAKIRENYFKLNSSDRYIWRVVCNDIDVRNERLDSQINSTLNKVDSGIASIWILGAPGCGKTTQMNRTTVDFALKEFPVILINTLNLDENTRIVDYEDYFKKIYHLHNAGLDSSDYKTLLIFIDNPTAKLEHVSNLLRHFDDYYENFRCVFLLFEREVRRREAEEEDYLLDLAERGSLKIHIDNQDVSFKEKVCRSFIQALELTGIDRDLAREAYFDKPDITLAEAVINFCKKTSSSRYRRIIMDCVDFDNVIHTLQLLSLSDMYKWVSVIYQFGLAMPVSLLKKVIVNFDESEYCNFQDFFNNAEYENLPLILEGNTVRTRHELLAEWYVEEKLKPTIQQRLVTLLNVIDIDDTYECSIFNSLLRHKAIVRKYFTGLNKNDLGCIQQKAAKHSVIKRNVMMMIGWIEYLKGDFAVAKNIFKSVMDSYPTFLPAILETAKMEFLLGKFPEAEKVLNDLLKLEPNSIHARIELARVYQAKGRYPEAEKVLNECLDISPNDLYARIELARVYQAKGRYPEAERVLNDLLKLDSEDLYARIELARVYQAQKRYPEAEKVLNECLGISPNDLYARIELARVYQAQGRSPEAERVLNDLLKLEPENLQARTELARVYQAQGRYPEAEKVLNDLLKLEPKSLQARTELARVYQAQGRYPEAERVLKECLNIFPNDLDSRTELARVYYIQKEYDKAIKYLKEYLELDPKGLHPRTELARVYQAQKRYPEAEKVLNECLVISPNDLYARTELARVYQAQKRYPEAEKVLNDLLKLDSEDLHHARTELARVYQAQERYPEAEKVLNECLGISPNDLYARTELARVYQAQGRYPEAEKVLNDLLKLDFEDLHARNELARIYITLGLPRRAKELILTYIRANQCRLDKVNDYLILTYLNSCSQMRRYQEGVEYVEKLDYHLFSPQLAEEYGRLLRSYDLANAVTFFKKASEKFNRSGRLLSEVAVCFKLAGRPDAKEFLEKAIRLNPYKEEKYWTFFNNPPIKRPLYLRNKDCIGQITDIDYAKENGIIKNQRTTFRFRSSKYTKQLFRKLKVGNQVFFDITERNYAVNVEPYFSSTMK